MYTDFERAFNSFVYYNEAEIMEVISDLDMDDAIDALVMMFNERTDGAYAHEVESYTELENYYYNLFANIDIPDDILLEEGFDPYEGCYTFDC